MEDIDEQLPQLPPRRKNRSRSPRPTSCDEDSLQGHLVEMGRPKMQSTAQIPMSEQNYGNGETDDLCGEFKQKMPGKNQWTDPQVTRRENSEETFLQSLEKLSRPKV
ncbi:MAG: hypothetical protein AAF489_17245, partial [Bacteroidota bacterium]